MKVDTILQFTKKMFNQVKYEQLKKLLKIYPKKPSTYKRLH